MQPAVMTVAELERLRSDGEEALLAHATSTYSIPRQD
jgi:hypothetical protein